MTVGPDFAQALRGGMAAALELLCVGAAAAGAAALMWALLDPVGRRPPVSAGPVAPAVTAPANIGLDPFFRGAPLDGGEAKADAQGFVLHATRVGADGRSSAILSAQGVPQTTYAVGEMIGNAQLVEIAHDHVIIERNGQRMNVAFPALQTFAAVPPLGGAARDANDVPATAPAPAQSAPVLEEMGLTPLQRGDDGAGYVVGDGSPLLAGAGFQPGDILLGADGQGLTPQNFENVRDRILAGAPVEIRFERDGRTMTKRIGGSRP